MLENLFKQRGHQIKDIHISGPRMVEWGDYMHDYLNLWHWITLILQGCNSIEIINFRCKFGTV